MPSIISIDVFSISCNYIFNDQPGKGEPEDAQKAKSVLYTMTESKYGFEGICLAENLEKHTGLDITTEAPSLFQISVAVMKNNTRVK